MFDIVLHCPEIPPNTGNVIRLTANIGARLHLVRPLGFTLEDRQMKRAGLDYHEYAQLHCHDDWAACRRALPERRFFALTTRGCGSYADVRYSRGDVLVFGSETGGLPAHVLDEFPEQHRLRIPLRPGNRSLNLSNAVAVVAYEAWRQQGYEGGL